MWSESWTGPGTNVGITITDATGTQSVEFDGSSDQTLVYYSTPNGDVVEPATITFGVGSGPDFPSGRVFQVPVTVPIDFP